MGGYKIMVDMDQTLIDAISSEDPTYMHSDGEIINYTLYRIGDLGEIISSVYTVKVSIRPHAIEMVRSIINNNHVYIIWSAGMYEYVHAIMKYFTTISFIEPTYIYTRKDMITIGKFTYKSMVSKGYDIDDILIIEDNRNFVHPDERRRIIDVSPWYTGKYDDTELKHVIQLLYLYDDQALQPIITRSFDLGPIRDSVSLWARREINDN
jgi:hypothetical protein